MPRQRKAQNGAVRVPLSTGRVANTTTSTPKLQTVYRIPTRGAYWECEKLAYEVLGTSPINVVIEWENIYRVSLDTNALENAIEWMDLDLSNVTLQTINGDVEFTGSITADWTFTGTTVSANTLEAPAANITSVAATDVNVSNVYATDISTASITTSWSASIWGNLTVTWTSTLSWNVSAWADLSVVGTITADWISASTGDIAALTSSSATVGALDVTNWASVAGGLSSDTLETSGNATVWGNLAVTWTSAFTGDVTVDNITSTGTTTLSAATVSGATTLNSLTVNGASTLTGNTSVWGNLSVSGNETVTGNSTVTGDAIFSSDVSVAEDLTVSGDTVITDDLTVNGSTHLNTFETTGSGSIGWNLSVDWSIAGWSSLVVENQIESGSVVTTNTTTDNLTVNGNIALWNNATAPDFILQDEKGAANGVAPLDANGLIDTQYLPPVYTTAIVKMGTGVFSNSDTSTVVDADITANSFVILSNYQDIVWDLNETISVWQITVVSNHTETWSYKYIIVNSIS